MKAKNFKKAVNWLGILILYHLIAMIIYGLFVSSMVTQLAIQEIYSEARVSVFVFDIILCVLFSVAYCKVESSFTAYRKDLRQSMKEEGFSLITYFKEKKLKDLIIKVIVFAIFQLPFLLFFSIWGLSYIATTGIEKFYIVDAGAYAIVGIPILGFILNTLLFSVIFIGVDLIFNALLASSLKKDLII